MRKHSWLMGGTLQKISLNVPHARYWESDELPMTTSIFSLQEHPRRTLLQEDVHSQCVGYENTPFSFQCRYVGSWSIGWHLSIPVLHRGHADDRTFLTFSGD